MTTTKQASDAPNESVILATQAIGRDEATSIRFASTVESLTIKTAEELGASTDLLMTVKARQRMLTDERLLITRPMDKAKAQVMALFEPAVARLVQAEATIKAAVLVYTKEQARLQREEQAKLEEAADRERLRLETLSDKQRAAGRDDRAAATEERAAIVQAPTVAPAEAPTGAVHVVVRWHAEVTSLKALVRAVAEGKQPLTLLDPNMTVLNMQARASKGGLKIPGVTAVSEEGVSARAG